MTATGRSLLLLFDASVIHIDRIYPQSQYLSVDRWRPCSELPIDQVRYTDLQPTCCMRVRRTSAFESRRFQYGEVPGRRSNIHEVIEPQPTAIQPIYIVNLHHHRLTALRLITE